MHVCAEITFIASSSGKSIWNFVDCTCTEIFSGNYPNNILNFYCVLDTALHLTYILTTYTYWNIKICTILFIVYYHYGLYYSKPYSLHIKRIFWIKPLASHNNLFCHSLPTIVLQKLSNYLKFHRKLL